MGTKNEPGRYDAYEKADPDEPMFTLLGRDTFGASLVRLWAAVRESIGTEKEKVLEARECAAHMEAWCSQKTLRQVRDVLHWIPQHALEEELKRREEIPF